MADLNPQDYLLQKLLGQQLTNGLGELQNQFQQPAKRHPNIGHWWWTLQRFSWHSFLTGHQQAVCTICRLRRCGTCIRFRWRKRHHA